MHKVLIVENSPVFRKLLVHFFEAEECTVRTAEDGLAAMNILESYHPDIVVTDIIMPKISGGQLCRIIRNTNKLKNIFVIVLSSIFTEDEGIIQDLKADLYYAKGTKVTLHKCIVDILDKYEKGVRRQPEIIHTERISARSITKELLTDRHHYETFFYTLAEAIVELNPNGQIIQANKAASDLFNQDISALLSRPLLAYLSGPPLSEVKEWINTINTNAPSTFISSYDNPLKTDGKLILLHLMSTVKEGDIYVSCSCQDITARKQAEQQLNQTHTHLQAKNREIESMNQLLSSTLSEYESIFNNSHLGIMIFQDGEFLTRCNQRMVDILGFNTPDELVGKPMDAIHLSEEEDIAFKEEYCAKLLNDTMERVECQLLRMDKSNVWCLISAKTLDQSFPANLSKGIIWIVEDISKRKSIEQEIRHQAHYDELTGLPNRRLLHTLLEKEVSRATRHEQNGALFFIDLDNFKTINDSLGHSAGDELLKLVAGRITNNLRKEDISSRMGGDEFVIILPNLHHNHTVATAKAQETAQKLCSLLSTPLRLNMQDIHITLSIGVTLFPSKGNKVEDILKQADTAMYRAKSAGRNTFRFFLPSMQEAADERLRLNTEIKRAIENNELTVFYQPQVNIAGDIVGAEALIRWNHPTRGCISPGEFIPIAEETGIIRDIGYWVLQSTCKKIKQWEDSSLLKGNQNISVNFSPKEFSAPDFVERVINTLTNTGASPSCLSIELTEGSLVFSVKDTIQKIEKLRNFGIKFSIDDFGTGYSSLSYLQKLPLNTLKIDRSFVSDIGKEKNDAIIVETIIMMAQNLGLEVIAEGVETEEEVSFLSSKGCTVYQGYYFSRPLEEKTFSDLLQKRLYMKSQKSMSQTHL